jgi:D-3-phosphoglycerate dehydrogenase / 2-oxoglutarate reductase
MFNVVTYDSIPADGLKWLSREKYAIGSECPHPDAILLRSFDLHGLPIPETVLAVGRAGSGVNNIPVEAYSKRGIPVFNTPGANANAVKELTIAGMFLASRNIAAALDFTRDLDGDDAAIQQRVEKEKKRFAGFELAGKKLGVVGLERNPINLYRIRRH